jgi:hypothetical protein
VLLVTTILGLVVGIAIAAPQPKRLTSSWSIAPVATLRPPRVTPGEPPHYENLSGDLADSCQISRSLSTGAPSDQMESPYEVFDELVRDVPAAPPPPLAGARPVLDMFRSNHMETELQDLGGGDAAASVGYASQAGMFFGSFLVDFDASAGRATPTLAVCGEPEDTTAHGAALYVYTGDRLDIIDRQRARVAASLACDNCVQPGVGTSRGGSVIDDGNAVALIRRWGTDLAVTRVDKQSSRELSSVVIDTEGGLVDVPGEVWTADREHGLDRWDPATGNRVEHVTVPDAASEAPDGLRAGGIVWAHSFWSFTTGPDGVIHELDSATGAVMNTVDVHDLVAVSAGEGHLWLTARTGSTDVLVEELNADTGAVTRQLTLHSLTVVVPDGSGGPATTETFVPDLQVDAKGIWFSMPEPSGDGAQLRTVDGVQVPDLGDMRFWGSWPTYRWEEPAGGT